MKLCISNILNTTWHFVGDFFPYLCYLPWQKSCIFVYIFDSDTIPKPWNEYSVSLEMEGWKKQKRGKKKNHTENWETTNTKIILSYFFWWPIVFLGDVHRRKNNAFHCYALGPILLQWVHEQNSQVCSLGAQHTWTHHCGLLLIDTNLLLMFLMSKLQEKESNPELQFGTIYWENIQFLSKCQLHWITFPCKKTVTYFAWRRHIFCFASPYFI